MALLRVVPLAALALLAGPVSRSAERAILNDNRIPAGELRSGVLTLRLEVREGEWHPDADTAPGLVVRAFAEAGKPPSIPGPLIRVPEGTEIRATFSNKLSDSTVYLHGFSPRGLAGPLEPLRLAPGESRELRFPAGAPGTYHYWGSTRPGRITERPPGDAELAGAFIIDPRSSTGPPRDRVLVLAEWNRDARPGGIVLRGDLTRFTINGKSWPHTERLSYAVGDTVRFRIVNASETPHPMHLHGFYFTVERRGDGSRDAAPERSQPREVVTERMAPGATIALRWIPERAGYWLFHCHNNYHILRNPPLDGSGLAPEHTVHPANHALELMGGLTLGIEVRARGPAATAEPGARRRLRLFAESDPDGGGTQSEPGYRYRLEETGRSSPPTAASIPGPLILLKRGEPVSLTVVNRLAEPTAVHWHGIELDSYMDGVAGYSGHPGRLAPLIAPGDSFEARFTPPRSGTFIYHPHADEVRQLQAGLSGALLVVDDPETYDPAHDRILLISTPRREADANRVYLNGSLEPPPFQLSAGERYRFRLINIHTNRPSMVVRLLQDSVPAAWRVLAKDGMELPVAWTASEPAVQQISNGETYDFEFEPPRPGAYRLTVSSGVGQLLVALPVVVR